MCYLKKIYKLIDKRSKAISIIMANEEKINRTNIMKYSSLTNNDLNKIYKIIEEGNSNYGDLYILALNVIDITTKINNDIRITKESGKREHNYLNIDTYIKDKSKLIKLNKLMYKYKNEQFVLDFKNLINEYNNLNKYSCNKCGAKVNKTNYERGVCLECLENEQDEYMVRCCKCNDLKPIVEYPKAINLKWGYKTIMCKTCDNKEYLPIRREVAYKYSLTEKGKESARRNVKLLNERLLCKAFNIKDKESDIQIKDYKDIDMLKIINNNPLLKEHFSDDMTMKEFFNVKKELGLEFDHIIPRTFANKVYDKFDAFKEVIDTRGLDELIKTISKIMNNERNIQLLSKEENNAKHNNILEKDYELRDSINSELINEIVNLYVKLSSYVPGEKDE